MVQPYVEVSFQRRKSRTSVSEGPNPQWNETLSLSLETPGNDFLPSSILESEVGMELIYVNLFDENIVNINQDDRNRDLEIHQRKERNWLGGFAIPFAALYEQIRVRLHAQMIG
jgi:coiled-coil and C2 domain-containing protein 2A